MSNDIFNKSFNKKVKKGQQEMADVQEINDSINNEIRLFIDNDWVERLAKIVDKDGNEKQKKSLSEFSSKFNSGDLTCNDIPVLSNIYDIFKDKMPEEKIKQKLELEE